MGTWGTKVFSDDFASDIRGEYEKYLALGKTKEEAAALVTDDMRPDPQEEDYPTFWIALAVAQWKKGRLLEETKEKALEILAAGGDLKRWEDAPLKRYEDRKKVLEDAKTMLLSPMPKAKKIPLPEWMQSDPWQVGDLISYRIMREEIPYPEYVGKYLILRVAQMAYVPTSKNYIAYYAVAAWCGHTPPTLEDCRDIEYMILYENDQKGVRYYQSTGNISLGKANRERHEVCLLANDPTFSPQQNRLLAGGASRGTMDSHAFDILISRALHQNQVKCE